MADQKVSDKTELTTAANDDELYIIDQDGGDSLTPKAGRRISKLNLLKELQAEVDTNESNITGLINGSLNDGWHPLSGTFSHSSSDSPTFVVSTPSDLTGLISVGCRFKCTDSGTQYFIVTAIDATTMTLYGGNSAAQGALSGGAITNPYFSRDKAPVGFSLDPDDWAELLNSSTPYVVSSPVHNTNYETDQSLDIPIGAWHVSFRAVVYWNQSGTPNGGVQLSIGPSGAPSVSPENSEFAILTNTGSELRLPMSGFLPFNFISKTTLALFVYYGNSTDTVTTLGLRQSVIRAISAYL